MTAVDAARRHQVLVLMSTWNGLQYLPQQLESLQRQNDVDWSLLVRDDGSSDGTVSWLAERARGDPRIEFLADSHGGSRIGACASFGRLIAEAANRGAPYVALCDQDDDWRPDKLSLQLAHALVIEAELGADTPALVHSDVELVDARGQSLAPSYMQVQRIGHPSNPGLPRLLFHNHVIGCTVLMNRALIRLATPVPRAVHMHDWWLGLCAASAGRLCFLPDTTVRYRRHGANASGVAGLAPKLVAGRRGLFEALRKMNKLFCRAFAQSFLLERRLRARRPPSSSDSANLEPRARSWESSSSELSVVARVNATLALDTVARLGRMARLHVSAQNLPLTALLYTQAATPVIVARARSAVAAASKEPEPGG